MPVRNSRRVPLPRSSRAPLPQRPSTPSNFTPLPTRVISPFLWGLGLALTTTLSVHFLRSYRETAHLPHFDLELDEDRAVEHLSKSLQFKTVRETCAACVLETDLDDASFTSNVHFLYEYFEEAFPLVHQNLKREFVGSGGYSCLYTWQPPRAAPRKGSTAPQGALLISHIDVVPAEESQGWTYPPFSGTVADGFVWGRGAMDAKLTAVAILEGFEALLRSGSSLPQVPVYIALGHDEEAGGENGAKKIAELLQRRGVK
ncbi:hypothetical protein CYMTET_53132, partial [Cymbomonas tetramitiformis]